MTMTNNTHAASGAANNCTILPDGSAFAVASFPLPKDHWLYAPREYDVDAENPKELPSPILTHALRAEVVSAIRYAIRGATMCGKETDFDPDALVQNAVYALCGPYGSAALAAPAQAAAPIKALTEAIAHAEDKAKGNSACAMEHAKLAAWLTELQLLRADRAARGAAKAAPVDAAVQQDAERWQFFADYMVSTRTDLDDEIVGCDSVQKMARVFDAARAAQEGKHD